jgi:hypothetical protein
LQLATNLATINLENNNLTDITPLSKLGASISWAGNPGSSGGSTQVPAVPPLGQLLMALGLFGIMTYLRRTSISKGVF